MRFLYLSKHGLAMALVVFGEVTISDNIFCIFFNADSPLISFTGLSHKQLCQHSLEDRDKVCTTEVETSQGSQLPNIA